MKTFRSLFVVLLALKTAYSQETTIDTSQTHPFNKSVMFSAIIPGAGVTSVAVSTCAVHQRGALGGTQAHPMAKERVEKVT